MRWNTGTYVVCDIGDIGNKKSQVGRSVSSAIDDGNGSE